MSCSGAQHAYIKTSRKPRPYLWNVHSRRVSKNPTPTPTIIKWTLIWLKYYWLQGRKTTRIKVLKKDHDFTVLSNNRLSRYRNKQSRATIPPPPAPPPAQGLLLLAVKWSKGRVSTHKRRFLVSVVVPTIAPFSTYTALLLQALSILTT